ncbi:MAG: hypothetical protein ACLTT1_08340 [[Clostridium] scindens]
MTEELKKRCIIYAVGVFVYVCGIAVTIQYDASDRGKKFDMVSGSITRL